MKCIENEIFYHIQSNGNWSKGDNYFIGQIKNNFVSYFDTNGHVIPDKSTGKLYTINDIANEMKDYISNNQKSMPFSSFYHYDVNKTLIEVSDALEYYLQLSRELIFEEVRKEYFPDLPSRYRCLWVIPDDLKSIQYWWNVLGSKGKILKVKLTGKLHKANQEYLRLRTDSMNIIRQMAFKYWVGASGVNSFEEECLFEGFAEVLDIIDSASLNL